MNMDEAKQVFLSECNELLEVLEQGLLQLEFDAGDMDNINALFRAAHTIKGSGGIFGFSRLESFTHRVENLLDRLRAGELRVSDALIATLLKAKDHMAWLVDIEMQGGAEGEGTEVESALAEQIHVLLGGEEGPSDDAVPEHGAMADGVAEEGGGVWLMWLRFSPDIVRNGLDPLALLGYLGRVGEVVQVWLDSEALPRGSDYHADLFYLPVLLHLEHITEAQIDDALEFFLADTEALYTRLDDRDGCRALTTQLPPHLLEQVQALLPPEQGTATGSEPAQQEDASPSSPGAGEAVPTAAASRPNPAGRASRSLRIDADKLDSLINLVGELVIAGASTHLIAQHIADDQLVESNSAMRRLVEEIRDTALRLRMVPIGETFSRFHRVVRDVSHELGKQVELQIAGAETELDKTVVEKIGDPLMHLVRNAIDHGVESVEQRQAAGKPEAGQVQLNAYHDSGSIVIEVRDDGSGIDEIKLMDKAIAKGLAQGNQQLSRSEILRLIFEPGLSTAAEVTSLSGRGVGMDVVKKNIEALRGTVDVESELGKGSCIRIRLPLTLAIIDGFLVQVGESSYVLPLDMVHECIEMTAVDQNHDHEGQYINLRGEVLPYLHLSQVFDEQERGARRNIVVVQYAGQKAGLVVDQLLGEVQTVIKPLGKLFNHLRCVSGSTILGSGDVAVILDVAQLLQLASENGSLASAAA